MKKHLASTNNKKNRLFEMASQINELKLELKFNIQ